MIGELPDEVGAAQVTVAWALPAVATGVSTAEGAADGATGVAGTVVAAGPLPLAFLATTEKVYAAPLVSPVMVKLSWPEVVQVADPGDAVTV